MTMRSCIDCMRIIPGNQTRCPAHEAAYKAQRTHQRGQYSAPSWRSLRARVLARGHCQDCGAKDADQVHHRFSVRQGNPLICPPGDLLLLCRPCHLRRERGHVEPTLRGLYKPPKREDVPKDNDSPFDGPFVA